MVILTIGQRGFYMLKNIDLGSLKNEDLGRTLTKQELAAVDWWVTKILYRKKTQYKYNAKRSIISCGNIPGILAAFKKHAGDKEWENGLRNVMKFNLFLVEKSAKQLALPLLDRQRGAECC